MHRAPCVRAWLAAALVAVASALTGCASTPQASPAHDAEAKKFNTHPGYSVIYVYRPDFDSSGAAHSDTVLYVGRRLIGATLPQTYFRVDVEPGTHMLRGIGVDQGTLKPETRSGEPVFVELTVTGGVSTYRLVDAETGKQAIRRCCVLLENWAPGQRPLLR